MTAAAAAEGSDFNGAAGPEAAKRNGLLPLLITAGVKLLDLLEPMETEKGYRHSYSEPLLWSWHS